MSKSPPKCYVRKYESHHCTGNVCHTTRNCCEIREERAGTSSPAYGVIIRKYDEILPEFELDGKSHYGDFAPLSEPPGNRHFIPRRAKLKAAGGRSISLYEKWRLMQYHTNCIMKRFLDLHAVNVSILPPCVNYDLWKYPKWKAAYDKPLDEDPCPDCDVRFSADADGLYRAKIAPASILVPSRWKKRRYPDTIILIGLPQHITVSYIKETSTQVYVEYVDPAGPSGDKRGSEEVQLWMHQYLGPRLAKPIRFYQAAKGINFQSDKNDVMCQTWIWYWVYFRLVRKIAHESLARHIYQLAAHQKSLQRIHRFNCWMADLYKLGFFANETPSQTRVAVEMTPSKPAPAARAEKKRSRVQNDSDSESESDDPSSSSSDSSEGEFDGVSTASSSDEEMTE